MANNYLKQYKYSVSVSSTGITSKTWGQSYLGDVYLSCFPSKTDLYQCIINNFHSYAYNLMHADTFKIIRKEGKVPVEEIDVETENYIYNFVLKT